MTARAENSETKVPVNGEENLQMKDKNFWERRSRLEKGLIIVVGLALLIIIILAILLGVLRYKKDEMEDICVSTGCVQAAAKLQNSIDFKVNPCDNFYQFACGLWQKRHIIPERKSYLATFSVLRDEAQVTLKYLLEDESSNDESVAVENSRKLYRSCINMSLIEDRNMSVAMSMLNDFGGWPVLGNKEGGNFDSSKFDLSLLLTKLMFYYNNPIIGLYVSVDSKNSSYRIIYIDQPGLNMRSREYFLYGKDDYRIKAYMIMAKKIMIEFGADETTVDRDLEDIVDLEIAIANITVPSDLRRDSELLYNKYTLQDLDREFPGSKNFHFSWREYIQGVFSMKDLEMKIDDDEPIILEEPRYYRKLFATLEQFSNRTIANAVIWSIMLNRARNLPQRFEDIMTEYNKVLTGRTASTPRWRKCVTYVNGQFGTAVGRLFVKEKFDEMAKKDMKQMIDLIQGAFGILLEELDWMDEDTKTAAKEKADSMVRKIGYEDYILDAKVLDKGYENYTMDEYKYFENVLLLLHIWVVDDFKNLRLPVNKKSWTTAPATVNAYYSATYNRIMFPAGILQSPYYHRNQPKSLNFGGIGSLIGHEITHGFDDNGRKYDKYGNMHQWWSDSAIEKFNNKTLCFVNQYSNFLSPLANIYVNGLQTLGENIADNGGLKQAYKGYRDWVALNGREEPRLPGMNLTNNQLFFVNFAQIRCSIQRPQDAFNQIMTGAHSPSRFRVLGTLQNMNEFAEAFNCPVGSYMNPKEKCRVW